MNDEAARKPETSPGVNRDGLAALGILAITVVLIVVVVAALI